ncbi:amino acid transporter transmembrane [Lichtheimia corymbifera JMRC:FSU:9682]|uniref:Amino acid transporter transmembrane n=1 Tax=Lichtheimia corymbifera JMRC:FSU:9682 TaxID=1263082 RepID=A0A068RT31_9FUNG|nr:amino acid transporter transmembrane [Lichtheimia corymbifera JMRC:FSU:9682]
MDIPGHKRSEDNARSLLSGDDAGQHYGATTTDDPDQVASSSSPRVVPTSRSFSEHIEGLVGSYTRTSLAYMTENLPIPSSAQPSPAADKLALPDEEQANYYQGDQSSLLSNQHLYAFPDDHRRPSYSTHLGPTPASGGDDRSSLLSFHDSTYSFIEPTYTNTSKDMDSTTIADHHQPVAKSSFWQAVFNSTNILMGVGILALPLGFKLAGWVIGTLVFIFCFVVTNYTAKILAKCLDGNPGAQTYGDVGYAAFGTRGRMSVSAIFVTELVAVCIALVIFLSDTISSLFPSLPNIIVSVISFLVLTPMLFVPVRHLSYASLLGVLIAVSILFLLLFDGFTKPDAPGSLIESAETEIFPSNWRVMPLSFGLIMAGFAGHSVFPTIYRDMENPKEYKSVVDWCYVATAIVYFFVAACGYRMFGVDTLEEITKNIVSIPEYNRLVNLTVLWLLALNPVSKYGLSLNPVDTTIKLALLRHPKIDVWYKENPRYGRVLLGIGTLILSATIVLMAYLVPGFDNVMGLLGAFFAFAISAIFPLMCHRKLYQSSTPRWQKILDYILIFISVAMAIAGTWASITK